MSMQTEQQPHMTKTNVEFMIWKCGRCGLLRSNKITHIHDVPMPENVVKMHEDLQKAKAEKQGERPEPGT